MDGYFRESSLEPLNRKYTEKDMGNRVAAATTSILDQSSVQLQKAAAENWERSL